MKLAIWNFSPWEVLGAHFSTLSQLCYGNTSLNPCSLVDAVNIQSHYFTVACTVNIFWNPSSDLSPIAQTRVQLCGDASRRSRERGRPAAGLQGHGQWRQLPGREEQPGCVPAERELRGVGGGEGHHRARRPAAVQRHDIRHRDPPVLQAPPGRPHGGGALRGQDDPPAHPLLLLPGQGEQGGQAPEEGRQDALSEQRAGGGGEPGAEEGVVPEAGPEVDGGELGRMLGDLRERPAGEAGALPGPGRAGGVRLRRRAAAQRHEVVRGPLSRVGRGGLVPLLQNLREGLQTTGGAMRHPDGLAPASGSLRRQTKAAGTGLLQITSLLTPPPPHPPFISKRHVLFFC